MQCMLPVSLVLCTIVTWVDLKDRIGIFWRFACQKCLMKLHKNQYPFLVFKRLNSAFQTPAFGVYEIDSGCTFIPIMSNNQLPKRERFFKCPLLVTFVTCLKRCIGLLKHRTLKKTNAIYSKLMIVCWFWKLLAKC